MILSGLINDVQVGKHRLSIAENIEYAVACGGTTRSITAGGMVFDEMQCHRVPARGDGNRVGEMSPALGLLELGIIRAQRWFRAAADLPTF